MKNNPLWRKSLRLLVLSVCLAGCDGPSGDSDTTVARTASDGSASTKGATTLAINDRIIADESVTSDWLAYGRTHSEQRFSPLEDVHVDNVDQLKVDWFVDLPNDIGLVSTPLVVDGVMYFTGTMNIVRAVDAVTGEMIWTFDPKVGEQVAGRRQIGWVHNRGITFYDDKVFAATWDGRLIAIDAKSGEQVWSATTFSPDRALYITGAPKAFKGKVLIGNGGTENGPSRGFVTAYDADSGEEAWKFYIVPGNPADGFEDEAMRMAAETWTGEWWVHGGGGNAWHGFTYDPEFDVVYVGTGNGSPWNRKIRSPHGGDNLFLCSIVALDAETGEYRWHYQTTPGETWDFNSNMDIVLADLHIDGRLVKALLHAPKNGFFYVIDRESGKLVSAEPFAETTWATHVDVETGRPVEVQGARYEVARAAIAPGAWGAHSWHAMSFNPETGLAYIPALHMTIGYDDVGIDLQNWRSKEFEGGFGVNVEILDEGRDVPASLIAWDPIQQKAAWEIPQPHFWNAGTLTTAGNLVFQGTADGRFVAYDARSGEQRWSFDAGLGISAPAITYKIGGRQYVSLLVGWGGGYAGLGGKPSADLGWSYRTHMRRLITFSLAGKAQMPPQRAPAPARPLDAPEFKVDAALADAGSAVYGNCSGCHGPTLYSGGMAPDLRASTLALSRAAFDQVVREGARSHMGMPAFPTLTDADVEALMHYIRQRANETLDENVAASAAPM